MSTKTCTKCSQTKIREEFPSSGGKCRDCAREFSREYRRSERGKQKAVEWTQKNRERMTELQAQWYQRNKEKRRADYNERYHTDHEFKFKMNSKRRILAAFKYQGVNKSMATIKYLNCSSSWLTEWFTFCFTPQMTLENHGSYWHMDHILPINQFNLNDSQHVRVSLAWFNLSPLPGNENISKHDKINVEQIKQHVQKLIDFLFLKNVFITHIEEYINFCARFLTMSGNSLEFSLPLLRRNV
jgi:hypothetical protein